MPKGKARQETEVEASAGLSAVIDMGPHADAEDAVKTAIQADEGEDTALDEPPVTGTYVEDEDEDESRKRERTPGGKMFVNGGMGQIQLFTFPLDPIVFWSVDAYTARRIEREALLPQDERGPSFASASYQERVARMVAECVGKCIVADFDLPPEERMFDWGPAMTLPLDLVVSELIERRWRAHRDLDRKNLKVRLHARFPQLSDRELDELLGIGIGG